MDSLKRSLGWLTIIRIVILLLILLSAALVQVGSGTQIELTFLYLLNAGALVLGLFHWTMGKQLDPVFSAYVQLFGDLGLVTMLVYSSGGPDSVFNFLYLVVIGVAAFLVYRTGSVLIATGSSVPRPARKCAAAHSRRGWTARHPCAEVPATPASAMRGSPKQPPVASVGATGGCFGECGRVEHPGRIADELAALVGGAGGVR